MKKICPDCLEVFSGYADVMYCPLAHCESRPLIPADDLYVDVVLKFLKLLISFNRVEAGTLEKYNGGPFVCFNDRYFQPAAFTMEMFFDLAVKANDGNVLVGEVTHKDDYKVLVVESKCNAEDTSPLARFESHITFVKYLYRLLDELKAKQDLLFRSADNSRGCDVLK